MSAANTTGVPLMYEAPPGPAAGEHPCMTILGEQCYTIHTLNLNLNHALNILTIYLETDTCSVVGFELQ